MAEGLAEPQWFNLAQKPTNHIMVTKVWFITGANRGIGAEIAKAALAAGTSLPTQASVASCHRSKANRAAPRPHFKKSDA
jgi:hypothetical protein